jgi:hypothetical protein
MSLHIYENSWPGFQGLYSNNHRGNYFHYYKINDRVYDAKTLARVNVNLRVTSQYMPFDIDTNGSEILIVVLKEERSLETIPYQQLSNGEFKELIPSSPEEQMFGKIHQVYSLKVPLPNGQEINGVFQSLPLRPLDDAIERLLSRFESQDVYEHQILEFLNSQNSEVVNNPLFEKSYENLVRHLYKLPADGIKDNLVTFQQISEMLSRNQIERFVIDPLSQSLTNPPNNVLTMYGKDGMIYLVKAKYDPIKNQILPPI